MTLRETLDETSTPLLLVAAIGVGAVLLIVAVLGTAVVGSFVLGAGGESVSSAAPNAAFSGAATDDGFVVEHTGGDTAVAATLLVSVDGDASSWAALTGTEEVAPGDSVEVSAKSGATVEVAFDGGDGPVTLAIFQV